MKIRCLNRLTNLRNVTWLANSIMRSSCAIDVRYFPFDQQNCSLKFGSWTYDGNSVDVVVVTEKGDISNYVPSGEWSLQEVTAKRKVVFYSCCVEPYPDITINILIRRRPLYYVFNHLMPCGCATLFAFLGFYTPGECGEKVTLGITTLLSLTLFMLMVGEGMPPTANSLPLIAVLYGISMVFVGLATAVQVWTLNLHYKGARGQMVPAWVKKLVLGHIASALCIRIVHREATDDLPDASKPVWRSDKGTMTDAGTTSQPVRENVSNQDFTVLHDLESPEAVLQFTVRIQGAMERICQIIDSGQRRVDKKMFTDALTLEWQNLAYVIDKLLMFLFVTSATIVYSTLLLNIP